jgi:hypothetical protein
MMRKFSVLVATLGCRRYPVKLFIQKWLKFRLEVHEPMIIHGKPAGDVVYRIDARVSRLSGYSPCLCPEDAMAITNTAEKSGEVVNGGRGYFVPRKCKRWQVDLSSFDMRIMQVSMCPASCNACEPGVDDMALAGTPAGSLSNCCRSCSNRINFDECEAAVFGRRRHEQRPSTSSEMLVFLLMFEA